MRHFFTERTTAIVLQQRGRHRHEVVTVAHINGRHIAGAQQKAVDLLALVVQQMAAQGQTRRLTASGQCHRLATQRKHAGQLALERAVELLGRQLQRPVIGIDHVQCVADQLGLHFAGAAQQQAVHLHRQDGDRRTDQHRQQQHLHDDQLATDA